MKHRIEYLDITKGIAIILMIIGHLIPYSFLTVLIYSFHVPLFIILSGYFYSKPNSKIEIKTRVKKYIKKLLVPYIMTLLICTIVDAIKLNDVSHIFNLFMKNILWGNGCQGYFLGYNFQGIGPQWFLLVLFISKICFDYINLKCKKEKNLTIIYCFSLLTGITIGRHIWLPQGIDLTFVFMFYLYVGFLLKKFKNQIDFKQNILFAISILLWGIITYYNGFIELAARSYPGNIVCIISSIFGSYCMLFLSKIIGLLKYIKNLLAFYGENSLLVLCTHSVNSFIFGFDKYSNNVNIIILLILLRFLIDLLSSYIIITIKNSIVIAKKQTSI